MAAKIFMEFFCGLKQLFAEKAQLYLTIQWSDFTYFQVYVS